MSKLSKSIKAYSKEISRDKYSAESANNRYNELTRELVNEGLLDITKLEWERVMHVLNINKKE